jgi:phosphoserine phosphatase RsbU/P
VEFIDLSEDPGIGRLVEILRGASRITDPKDVVGHFAPVFLRSRPMDLFISISTRGLPPGMYKITRRGEINESIRRDGPPEGFLRADPWGNWDRLPTHRVGFLGQIIEHGTPTLVRGIDVPDDPVLGRALRDMRACVAAPHYDEGEALNWAIYFVKDPAAVDESTLGQTFLLGNLVGSITRNLAVIREVQRLNDRLQAQFEEVARVQRSLLPQRLPEIPGMSLASSYLTSDEAGGDYYDFFPFPDGTWGIVIADVAGHGAAAATVMAMLRAILHAYPASSHAPDEVLSYANARLHGSGVDGRFVTAFYAVYDPAAGTMTYSRGGHNPPRLKNGRTGAVRALDGAGTVPLGLFEDFSAFSETVVLSPGDTLVLYTDGITEAHNREREMFGVHRMDEALEQCSGEPDCTVDSIYSALFRHVGSMTRDDDQTIVAMRYTGPVR